MKKYRVKSETNPKNMYEVRHFEESNKFVCAIEATGKLCPSYVFGKVGFECKHITKTKKYLNQIGVLKEPLPEEPPEIKDKKKLVKKKKKEDKEIKTKIKVLDKKIKEWWVKEMQIVEIKNKKGKVIKKEKKEVLVPNKKFKKEINEHQKLAHVILVYETENDMLPL